MANVTCDDPNGWRELGIEPKDVCQITQELMSSTCPGGNLSRLPKSGHRWYTAQEFQEALECACTQVMYNLLVACAGCQNWNTVDEAKAQAIKWPSLAEYEGDMCSNQLSNRTNPTTHSKREPAWAVEVPSWAQSWTGEFDLAQVLSQAGSSGTNGTNGNGNAGVDGENTTSTTGIILPTSQPDPSATATPQSSNSGPNIGAIVGGVVGGLVFLGALVGLWFWLHRRRRRSRDVAPSAEFIKPEYYATPPLLAAGHDRRDSDYCDDVEEEPALPSVPAPTNRLSWAGGLVTTRRREEDDDGDMLPPFTRGTYIGPSPHEKGHPERRETGDSDLTTRTNTTHTHLLTASPDSPARRNGPSEHFP